MCIKLYSETINYNAFDYSVETYFRILSQDKLSFNLNLYYRKTKK
jgi:hypothetical protein